MNKELNLQIPDSLYSTLDLKAKGQGVSLEALCLLLLEGKSVESLVDPGIYTSLSTGQLRSEIVKVLNSDLPKEETQKRVRQLESQILRCFR